MSARFTFLGRRIQFLAVVFAAMMVFGATGLNPSVQASDRYPIDISAWCQKQGKEAILFITRDGETPNAKSWRCGIPDSVEYYSGSESTTSSSSSATTVTRTGSGTQSGTEVGSSTSDSSGVTVRYTDITPISNMSEVCVDQYEFYFEAAIDDWSDPYGWYCQSTVTF